MHVDTAVYLINVTPLCNFPFFNSCEFVTFLRNLHRDFKAKSAMLYCVLAMCLNIIPLSSSFLHKKNAVTALSLS